MSSSSIHFCFPIRELEDDRVKLVPFDTWKHGPKFYEAMEQSPKMLAHISSGPYRSVTDFVTSFLAERSYPDISMFTFAIIDCISSECPSPMRESQTDDDNGDDGKFAGMVSFTDADADNRCANIGLLHILPELQSQGIATRVGRLLLHYGMNSPDQGGIGLVRMKWQSSTKNEGSIKLAERLGLQKLGVVRYERLLKNGMARGKVGNGRPSPPGTGKKDLWRDVVAYGISWDEWPKVKQGWK